MAAGRRAGGARQGALRGPGPRRVRPRAPRRRRAPRPAEPAAPGRLARAGAHARRCCAPARRGRRPVCRLARRRAAAGGPAAARHGREGPGRRAARARRPCRARVPVAWPPYAAGPAFLAHVAAGGAPTASLLARARRRVAGARLAGAARRGGPGRRRGGSRSRARRARPPRRRAGRGGPARGARAGAAHPAHRRPGAAGAVHRLPQGAARPRAGRRRHPGRGVRAGARPRASSPGGTTATTCSTSRARPTRTCARCCSRGPASRAPRCSSAGLHPLGGGRRPRRARGAHRGRGAAREVRRAVPPVRVAGEGHDADRDPAVAAAHLPTIAWRTAKEALERGPVLVQVPRRGYLPSLSCQDCRRPARCTVCAGPLGAPRAAGAPGLPVVRPGRDRPSRCPACGGHRLRSSVVGARRTAEELGRAFPGVPVERSGAGTVLDAVGAGPRLVVSTPGAEPVAPRRLRRRPAPRRLGAARAPEPDRGRGVAAALARRRGPRAAGLRGRWPGRARRGAAPRCRCRPSRRSCAGTPRGSPTRELEERRAAVPAADGIRLAALTGRPGRARGRRAPSSTCPPTAAVLGPAARTGPPSAGARSSPSPAPTAPRSPASWPRCARGPRRARTPTRSPCGSTRRTPRPDRLPPRPPRLPGVSVTPIRLFGDPVLRTPAEPVVDFDAELRRLVARPHRHDAGCRRGRSRRPPAGVGLRVFTYQRRRRRRSPRQPRPRPSATRRRPGPRAASPSRACASTPPARCRPWPAAGRCFGEPVTVEGTHLLARAVQHETDHLDGILFVDRLDPEQRREAMRLVREADWGRPPLPSSGSARTPAPSGGAECASSSPARPDAAVPSLLALLGLPARGRRGRHPPRRAERAGAARWRRRRSSRWRSSTASRC